MLFRIGNYYDMDVYDDTELSAETVDILVSKCANVLRILQPSDSQKPIVLFLPNVMQLPIAVLAALRIGRIFLLINASITREELCDILKSANAETIITVDGFWMGTNLIRTKEYLDEAMRIAALTEVIRNVLVIRHVTPNEGVPPPRVHLVARRPYYLYKVSRPFSAHIIASIRREIFFLILTRMTSECSTSKRQIQLHF
ncbi:unnamed protein product [Gongylonema pulchrum]|uniref:acetate--CoA ligase n=1 Tax=Gongylonema pulchrum TaxID=637853 RepID=A0A183D0H8_9BILA|nr:unnamed protein product [Gongylonema pulchrum]